MNILAFIVRIFVGGLFIFSGLIKINDPVGTAIKLEEYFEVFSSDFGSFFQIFVPIALPLAVFIVVLEFVLGIAIILNYRTSISFVLLLFLIVFFTFLTFYSAYFNKVTDCGCFGDAIKLTPWESFYKDIILLVCSIFLLIFSTTQQSPKFRQISDYIILVFTTVGIWLSIHAINHLPFIDFRAYKIGTDIPAAMLPSEELKYEYVMEKDGKEFRFENYPTDKSYEYKELVLLNPEAQPKITDFAVWSDEGDFTQEMFRGAKLFLIMYDINKSKTKNIEDINKLQADLGEEVQVISLTASDSELFRSFQQEANLNTPYYYTDATVLKTINRSNPGLWLMQDGKVKGKWHHNDVPSKADLLALLD